MRTNTAEDYRMSSPVADPGIVRRGGGGGRRFLKSIYRPTHHSWGRQPLEGSGMLPRKILKSKASNGAL